MAHLSHRKLLQPAQAQTPVLFTHPLARATQALCVALAVAAAAPQALAQGGTVTPAAATAASAARAYDIPAGPLGPVLAFCGGCGGHAVV